MKKLKFKNLEVAWKYASKKQTTTYECNERVISKRFWKRQKSWKVWDGRRWKSDNSWIESDEKIWTKIIFLKLKCKMLIRSDSNIQCLRYFFGTTNLDSNCLLVKAAVKPMISSGCIAEIKSKSGKKIKNSKFLCLLDKVSIYVNLVHRCPVKKVFQTLLWSSVRASSRRSAWRIVNSEWLLRPLKLYHSL